MRIQLIGYAPLNRPIQLDAGTTIRPHLRDRAHSRGARYRGGKSAYGGLFNVTPGRVKYVEHMKLNVGQMVSGLEIQRSKLGLLEFLGTVPGLRYLPGTPMVITARAAASAPPIIPGMTGYLRGTDGGCLYGRVDHWAVAYLLYTQSVFGIDELIDVADIMGVEVFSFDEVPKEWRLDANPWDFLAALDGSRIRDGQRQAHAQLRNTPGGAPDKRNAAARYAQDRNPHGCESSPLRVRADLDAHQLVVFSATSQPSTASACRRNRFMRRSIQV